MEEVLVYITALLLFIIIRVGTFLLASLLFWFLWNVVVPSVLGGPVLTYGSAMIIIVLLTLISSFLRR